MILVRQDLDNAAIRLAGHYNRLPALDAKRSTCRYQRTDLNSHRLRIRMSIATHIHGTSSNVGSEANRPSQSFTALAISNSRVNSNRSHRLQELHVNQCMSSETIRPTFRKFEALCLFAAYDPITEDLRLSVMSFECRYKSELLVQHMVLVASDHS